MFAVAIFYLVVGHMDFIIKKMNGRRNPISISIYRNMRNVGWIMLAGSFGNLIYESVYWYLSFLAIAYVGIRIIFLSNKIEDAKIAEITEKYDLMRKSSNP